MRVDDLLRYKDLSYYQPDDVRRVVENNSKKRFEMTFDGDVMKVRANQGHTLEVSGAFVRLFTLKLVLVAKINNKNNNKIICFLLKSCAV